MNHSPVFADEPTGVEGETQGRGVRRELAVLGASEGVTSAIRRDSGVAKNGRQR